MLKSNRKTLVFNFENLSVFFFCCFYISSEKRIELDIFRALNWLNDAFYWPGTEMSAGGNLPGPFFCFLLFPPLQPGDNIYSQSILWLIIRLALTWTIAFYFLSKITTHKESRLAFLCAFSLRAKIFQPLNWAWNSGFSILFHILALMNLYNWAEKQKSIYTHPV